LTRGQYLTHQGWTHLQDQLSVIRLLVQSGAGVNVADSKGCTALHHTCSRAATQMLLRGGADPFAKNAAGECVYAHLKQRRGDLARYLEIMCGV